MPRLNAQGIPEWEYEVYPSKQIREERCQAILLDIAGRRLDLKVDGADTRPVHLRMFDGMTEPGEEYFAGHYRGEAFPFLEDYFVGVPGDGRVGAHPRQVEAEMQNFAGSVRRVAEFIDNELSALPEREKSVRAVGLACALLVEFLRIHPYANGNGHLGRFLVWLALARAGIWPRRWPLNEKVPQPYYTLLSEFRNGNRTPLIIFVLSHV